jgi:hypothetical protein
MRPESQSWAAKPHDLPLATRIVQPSSSDKHGCRLEELYQRHVVTQQERVLQQRLELLGRTRSTRHDSV